MARAAVNIRGVGDKLLVRELRRFDGTLQKKLVRRTTKASAKRMKRYVVSALTEHIDTGELVAEILSLKVGPLKRRVAVQGHGLPRPRTKELAIRLNVLEYGFKNKRTGRFIPPKAPVRKAVNSKIPTERSTIQGQLKREIEKEWKKIARKLAKARR